MAEGVRLVRAGAGNGRPRQAAASRCRSSGPAGAAPVRASSGRPGPAGKGPYIPVVVRVRRPENGLDSPRPASNTPRMVDPLVAALAQLVRDRWAAEQRERAARRTRLKVLEGKR